MPATIVLQLSASLPARIGTQQPISTLFSDVLNHRTGLSSHEQRRDTEVAPYATTPIRRRQVDQAAMGEVGYEWCINVLDDTLVPNVLQTLDGVTEFNLDEQAIKIRDVATKLMSHHEIVQKARTQASENPERMRYIGLEFVTPAILLQNGLPMPLPEPSRVFHYYLRAWNAFAPEDIPINVNLLDAIAFHVGVAQHRLQTVRVVLSDDEVHAGCVGRITFAVERWQKLGADFLGQLHTLARFAEWCGTGEHTTRGLGETRYLNRAQKITADDEPVSLARAVRGRSNYRLKPVRKWPWHEH